MLFDAVRGVTKRLFSNSTAAEGTDAQTLTLFDSDGFTTGNNRATGGDSGNKMVAWNWKANGAGSSNSDGSITSTVSANTTAGFSIVKVAKSNTNEKFTLDYAENLSNILEEFKTINSFKSDDSALESEE